VPPAAPEPEAAPGPKDAVRDAATVILVRREAGGAQVLMGQRGSAAAFMPDLFVFPGGAVEPADHALADAPAAPPELAARLAVDAAPEVARALPLAAIRELWEETGLAIARTDPAAAARAGAAPAAWRGFLAAGLAPRTDALRFVFRAVTPPGRPRRFDARFFLADAEALAGDPTAFLAVDHELRALQWIALARVHELPLPFITTVVLAEVEALLSNPAPRPAPYFHHDARGSHMTLI
jgi:8-oxo-dGTP pyrophosphatase MutT (NUDIX family)